MSLPAREEGVTSSKAGGCSGAITSVIRPQAWYMDCSTTESNLAPKVDKKNKKHSTIKQLKKIIFHVEESSPFLTV